MSHALAESFRWPARKWWLVLALVLGAQLGLIFWLGEKSFPPPRPAARSPSLSLMNAGSSELLSLNDPTLFALPQRQGFSGIAWLKPPLVPFQPDRWTEPPRFLELSPQQLGGSTTSNQVLPAFAPRLPPRPDPLLTSPIAGSLSLGNDHSSVRIEGKLGQRRLLTTFNLPSWPSPDILTNTVVQLLVDARGLPLSASLLSRSGSKNADQFALDQANAARFASVVQTGPNHTPNSQDNVSLGEIVFEWHTLAPTETNAAPNAP